MLNDDKASIVALDQKIRVDGLLISPFIDDGQRAIIAKWNACVIQHVVPQSLTLGANTGTIAGICGPVIKVGCVSFVFPRPLFQFLEPVIHIILYCKHANRLGQPRVDRPCGIILESFQCFLQHLVVALKYLDFLFFEFLFDNLSDGLCI